MSDAILREMGLAVGDTVSVDGADLRIAQRFEHPPIDPRPLVLVRLSGPARPAAERRPPPAVGGRLAGDRRRARGHGVQRVPGRRPAAHAHRRGGGAEGVRRGHRAMDVGVFQAPRSASNATSSNASSSRAIAVRTTVERNLAPVTLTGVVAGTIVLVAAGVLLARDRQRELRLLAVRGHAAATDRVACRPSPRRRDRRRQRRRLVHRLVGDQRVRAVVRTSNRARSLRSVAWVVAAAVLALAARRRGGGVRRRRVRRRSRAARPPSVGGVRWGGRGAPCLAGDRLSRPRPRRWRADVRGRVTRREPAGDGLPAVRVAGDDGDRRARRRRRRATPAAVGSSLRRWLRLGWRRVVLDSGPLVAVVVSAGLAAGCFTVAERARRGRRASARRQGAGVRRLRPVGRRVRPGRDPGRLGGAGHDDLEDAGAVRRHARRSAGDRSFTVRRRGDAAARRSERVARSSSWRRSLQRRWTVVRGDRRRRWTSPSAMLCPIEVPGTVDPVPVTIAATADFFPTKITQSRCSSSTATPPTRCRSSHVMRC